MITTANYLLIAHAKGEQYYFEYEDASDKWEALDQFWHEDYIDAPFYEVQFAVDVLAMDDGKVIRRYETAFDCGHYHAFFDNGHTVNGTYTANEFDSQMEAIRRELDEKKEDHQTL